MNGLEALDSVRCALSLCPNHNYKKENDICDIIEKELKALEIIKNKKVNVPLFIERSGIYNCYVGYEVLTQEEYVLLKEVLK